MEDHVISFSLSGYMKTSLLSCFVLLPENLSPVSALILPDVYLLLHVESSGWPSLGLLITALFVQEILVELFE